MKPTFSDRINDVPRSFIREILKVAVNPEVISFAGGLPNRDLFPVDEIRRAADAVLGEEGGASALQYGSSEGFMPLREWISNRYRQQGLDIDPGEIMITTGSQQGLDLLAKVLLNEGDHVAIEEPGYLGAIQAFSVYRPSFLSVEMDHQGAQIDALESALGSSPRLFYSVPNFQNPTGISYSAGRREAIAERIEASDTWLIEDNPYGELRFSGTPAPSFAALAPERTVLLGSFSKTVAPSFRVGWLVARGELYDKLLIAKQATDLHTSELVQRIVHRYLCDNDIDAHIRTICEHYGAQCRAMQEAIKNCFGADISMTNPEGGMFLWLELPQNINAMALFERAIRNNVAFVPGDPFFTDGRQSNAMRLNFSCSDADEIREGIGRLAASL